MYKLTTLYHQVDDEQALETFFSATHLPLVEQLPGLLKREVSRITGKPGGQSRYHLMLEAYFESQESYLAAIATPAGLSLIQALLPWHEAKIISWFYAESWE